MSMAAETLREHSARWLQLVRPTLRWNTVCSYDQTLTHRILPFLGDTPLESLNRVQLKAWFIEQMGKTKVSTAIHSLSVLHVVLAAAVEDEVIPKNPASAIRRSLRNVVKARTYREPMTKDQLHSFLEAARSDQETYHGVLLMAYTGVRLGEALGLQWADVDLSGKFLRVQRQGCASGEIAPLKSESARRSIPISTHLANVLWRVRTDRETASLRFNVPCGQGVIFADIGKEPNIHNARARIKAAVKRACKKAGLPPGFSCHTLRHTYGTQLFEHGAHPKLVQKLMGHSTLGQTDLYTRYALTPDVSAVEKMSAGLDGAEKS
jgi:integrase